ncbi:MAG: SH3 domain-containing protein [Christensenellales bacterium]
MKTYRIFALICAIILAVAVIGLAESKEIVTVGAVILEDASLLSGPAAEASLLATIKQGEHVSVSELGLAWCKVKTLAGTDGYVSSRMLQFVDELAREETFAIVAAKNGRLTLREKDSTKSKALSKHNNGTIAVVLEKGKSFTKVFVAGQVGYLLTAHLEFTADVQSQGLGQITWPDKPDDTTHKVRVRWQNKTGDNTLGQFMTGTVVQIFEKGEDWSKIQVEDQVGYIMSKYLTALSSLPAVPLKTEEPSQEEGLEPLQTPDPFVQMTLSPINLVSPAPEN